MAKVSLLDMFPNLLQSEGEQIMSKNFDEVEVFRPYEVQWYSKRYSKWKYSTTKPDEDTSKSYATLLLEAYGEWAKAARVVNIKTEEVIETWINPRPDERLLDEPEHADELVRHLRLAMSL